MRQLSFEKRGPRGNVEGMAEVRLATFDKFEEIKATDVIPPYFVAVCDLSSKHPANPIHFLNSVAEWEDFRSSLEKDAAWAPDENAIMQRAVRDREIRAKRAEAALDALDIDFCDSKILAEVKEYLETKISEKTAAEARDEIAKERAAEMAEKESARWTAIDMKREVAYKEGEAARKTDMVNKPPHYQGYLGKLQWLETMSRLNRFADNPDVFIGAVELQIRKYLDRGGKKGDHSEDLLKASWYARYLAAYMRNDCSPIRIENIPRILGEG